MYACRGDYDYGRKRVPFGFGNLLAASESFTHGLHGNSTP